MNHDGPEMEAKPVTATGGRGGSIRVKVTGRDGADEEPPVTTWSVTGMGGHYEPPIVMGGQGRSPRELVHGAGIWFVGIIIGSGILGGLIGFAIGRWT